MSQFAATLQVFFTDRLIRQRQASPHTIACDRRHFREAWRRDPARRGPNR